MPYQRRTTLSERPTERPIGHTTPATLSRLLPVLLATLLAVLSGCSSSPGVKASPHATPSVSVSATPCTSTEPLVCKIRAMSPKEREKARETRVQYHRLLDRMHDTVDAMRAQGKSDEDIARKVVDMRNQAKDITRSGMSPEDVKALEERNIKKYGNPLGPTADQQFARYGSWAEVIEAAMRSNPAIDRELGLKPHQ
ncbi:hypothetical protein T261_1583 [Streptomyces lydicus]|nr:hypothetical protein T261_1583 [Streptomyces lydicus]